VIGQSVPRGSVAALVSELLDSPEIADLISELDALRWTGRKGYGVRALTPLRVRGLERVALHADLCILATLASALARARAVPLAA
jgi:hypothetical protein